MPNKSQPRRQVLIVKGMSNPYDAKILAYPEGINDFCDSVQDAIDTIENNYGATDGFGLLVYINNKFASAVLL